MHKMREALQDIDSVPVPLPLPFLSVTLLANPSGYTMTDVGTSYVNVPRASTRIDVFNWRPKEFRVHMIGIGNESGTKTLAVDVSSVHGTATATVNWSGTSESTMTSSWVPAPRVPFRNPTYSYLNAQAKVKGSSATEDITLYRIELQFR